MCLPLSHWTYSRGVETSLVTTMLEASVTLRFGYTAYNLQMEVPCRGGCGLRVYWLYKHTA